MLGEPVTNSTNPMSSFEFSRTYFATSERQSVSPPEISDSSWDAIPFISDRRVIWSEEMDKRLSFAIIKYGEDWDLVCEDVGAGLMPSACWSRWKHLKQKLLLETTEEPKLEFLEADPAEGVDIVAFSKNVDVEVEPPIQTEVNKNAEYPVNTKDVSADAIENAEVVSQPETRQTWSFLSTQPFLDAFKETYRSWIEEDAKLKDTIKNIEEAEVATAKRTTPTLSTSSKQLVEAGAFGRTYFPWLLSNSEERLVATPNTEEMSLSHLFTKQSGIKFLQNIGAYNYIDREFLKGVGVAFQTFSETITNASHDPNVAVYLQKMHTMLSPALYLHLVSSIDKLRESGEQISLKISSANTLTQLRDVTVIYGPDVPDAFTEYELLDQTTDINVYSYGPDHFLFKWFSVGYVIPKIKFVSSTGLAEGFLPTESVSSDTASGQSTYSLAMEAMNQGAKLLLDVELTAEIEFEHYKEIKDEVSEDLDTIDGEGISGLLNTMRKMDLSVDATEQKAENLKRTFIARDPSHLKTVRIQFETPYMDHSEIVARETVHASLFTRLFGRRDASDSKESGLGTLKISDVDMFVESEVYERYLVRERSAEEAGMSDLNDRDYFETPLRTVKGHSISTTGSGRTLNNHDSAESTPNRLSMVPISPDLIEHEENEKRFSRISFMLENLLDDAKKAIDSQTPPFENLSEDEDDQFLSPHKCSSSLPSSPLIIKKLNKPASNLLLKKPGVPPSLRSNERQSLSSPLRTSFVARDGGSEDDLEPFYSPRSTHSRINDNLDLDAHHTIRNQSQQDQQLNSSDSEEGLQLEIGWTERIQESGRIEEIKYVTRRPVSSQAAFEEFGLSSSDLQPPIRSNSMKVHVGSDSDRDFERGSSWNQGYKSKQVAANRPISTKSPWMTIERENYRAKGVINVNSGKAKKSTQKPHVTDTDQPMFDDDGFYPNARELQNFNLSRSFPKARSHSFSSDSEEFSDSISNSGSSSNSDHFEYQHHPDHNHHQYRPSSSTRGRLSKLQHSESHRSRSLDERRLTKRTRPQTLWKYTKNLTHNPNAKNAMSLISAATNNQPLTVRDTIVLLAEFNLAFVMMFATSCWTMLWMLIAHSIVNDSSFNEKRKSPRKSASRPGISYIEEIEEEDTTQRSHRKYSNRRNVEQSTKTLTRGRGEKKTGTGNSRNISRFKRRSSLLVEAAANIARNRSSYSSDLWSPPFKEEQWANAVSEAVNDERHFERRRGANNVDNEMPWFEKRQRDLEAKAWELEMRDRKERETRLNKLEKVWDR
ncbi:hypothetical protein HK098_005370 [Nowakowskiella sp. JEL0407]|nr:hypothetical protein HK098_005370 [Nowakowskiella sp. JEL0407]